MSKWRFFAISFFWDIKFTRFWCFALFRSASITIAAFNIAVNVVGKANTFDCRIVDNVKPLLNGCVSCNGQIAIYGSVTIYGSLICVNCDVLRGCYHNIAVR